MSNIAFEKLILSNGLEVIFHEDHSLPTVAVNIWYHVGSKNETLGQTGFAHLFEHMMFEGSKHHNRNYFEPIQKIGGVLMDLQPQTEQTTGKRFLQTIWIWLFG